jgi:hypothetical protein
MVYLLVFLNGTQAELVSACFYFNVQAKSNNLTAT